MIDRRWSAAAPPQSFTDVVEIVLQEYEPVQRISVIVAVASAARDRLAGLPRSAGSLVAVLTAARADLDAMVGANATSA